MKAKLAINDGHLRLIVNGVHTIYIVEHPGFLGLVTENWEGKPVGILLENVRGTINLYKEKQNEKSKS